MFSNVRLLLAAAAASALGACTYSPDCSDYMHYDPMVAACMCDENTIPGDFGCDPCAADEIAVSGACACPPGLAKDAAGNCAVVPGLGDSCDTTHPCTDSVYGTCAETSSGAFTCTRTCATDEDCPAAYTCADWEPEPYCRVFTGTGTACESTDDCAGFDADFCGQGTCVVHGCTVGIDECPRGTECCDLSQYGVGTLCVQTGACP